MKCLVKAAAVVVWGVWLAIVGNGLFGCGGGGGDAAPAATPTNTNTESSTSCAVEIGGDFFLCLDETCQQMTPIEDEEVEEETARIWGKINGVVVNINMCSSQDFSQSETTTTTTTTTETNEVQP